MNRRRNKLVKKYLDAMNIKGEIARKRKERREFKLEEEIAEKTKQLYFKIEQGIADAKSKVKIAAAYMFTGDDVVDDDERMHNTKNVDDAFNCNATRYYHPAKKHFPRCGNIWAHVEKDAAKNCEELHFLKTEIERCTKELEELFVLEKEIEEFKTLCLKDFLAEMVNEEDYEDIKEYYYCTSLRERKLHPKLVEYMAKKRAEKQK